MMQTKQRGNPPRRKRIFVPSGLIFLGIVIAMIWIIDSVWRKFLYQPPDPEVWLEVNGTFADHPLEPVDPENDDITISVPEKEETAEPDPFAETKEANSSSGFVYVPHSCVLLTMESSALRNGKLLQLDSKHEYSGYEGEMKTLSESAGGYNVHAPGAELMSCTLEAMDKMAQSYNAATGEHNLLAYSTTKAPDHSIYERELPDMKTGYCIDLAYHDEEGRIVPMYSRDAWLENNAYRYGFVFSYTEDDEEVTGISSAPYHLRYVGLVHASIMHDKGLSLAAYLKMLKSYSTSSPLYYETDDQIYSVYYVQRSLGSTDVPVPKNGNYDISGDNGNGFIVAAEGKIK